METIHTKIPRERFKKQNKTKLLTGGGDDYSSMPPMFSSSAAMSGLSSRNFDNSSVVGACGSLLPPQPPRRGKQKTTSRRNRKNFTVAPLKRRIAQAKSRNRCRTLMAQRPPSSLMQSDICLDRANMKRVCERFHCEISQSDCEFGQGKHDS